MDEESIITLQTALATLGFRLEISGSVDALTIEALKDFQRNVLLEVTGQPDAETLKAIRLLDNAWVDKDLPLENTGR